MYEPKATPTLKRTKRKGRNVKGIRGFIAGLLVAGAFAGVQAQAGTPYVAVRKVTLKVAGPFPCTPTQVLSKRLTPTPLRSGGVRQPWRCVEVDDL